MSRSASKNKKSRSSIWSGTSGQPGYAALQHLLQEFASALLPRGMTPKFFGELARSAFVQAAAEKSRLQNGRINQSRVAAQTGLSRADVKRLLHLTITTQSPDQSPVQRVLSGWRRDSLFTDRKGHAKRLTIAGRRPAFKHLAEKYAGDIPYRAVLDELNTMRAIVLTSRHVELRRMEQSKRPNDYSFLTPLAGPFKDGLRIVSTAPKLRAASLIQRLHLPVNTEIDLEIVKARCIDRATSMLEGLSHSINQRVTVPPKRSNAAYSFTVTVLLAENRKTRSSRQQNGGSGRSTHGQ
jgi:hypothetical protein